MSRIESLDPSMALGRGKDLLDSTKAQLGRIPNLYAAMAQSPASLDGYLAFRAALGRGALSMQMRERIALLTASMNDCEYCVSAHTFRGGKIGISPAELASTQKSRSGDPKTASALRFVDTLITKRGRISDDDFAELKSYQWSDEEIGEMVGHVALNVFSNYFNHVAKPELDFPVVAVER